MVRSISLSCAGLIYSLVERSRRPVLTMDWRVKPRGVRLSVAVIGANASATATSGRNERRRDISRKLTFSWLPLSSAGPCDPGSPCAAAPTGGGIPTVAWTIEQGTVEAHGERRVNRTLLGQARQ